MPAIQIVEHFLKKLSFFGLFRAFNTYLLTLQQKKIAFYLVGYKKVRIFAAAFGKLPEWSIGPHSKCGVRVTVPGVRIPHFPQQKGVLFSGTPFCFLDSRRQLLFHLEYAQKKWVSYLYRTATTSYPCCCQALGEFKGSWSYRTYPLQK